MAFGLTRCKQSHTQVLRQFLKLMGLLSCFLLAFPVCIDRALQVEVYKRQERPFWII
jgi:hypothetical protein